MKKGQAEEIAGIAILVLVLVVMVIFSKMYFGKKEAVMSSEYVVGYKKTSSLMAMSTLPRVTINKTAISTLFGYCVCYNTTIVDYGSVQIDVETETNKKLDILFGKGNWLLTLEGPYNFTFGNKNLDSAITYDFVIPLPCDFTKYGEGKLYAK